MGFLQRRERLGIGQGNDRHPADFLRGKRLQRIVHGLENQHRRAAFLRQRLSGFRRRLRRFRRRLGEEGVGHGCIGHIRGKIRLRLGSLWLRCLRAGCIHAVLRHCPRGGRVIAYGSGIRTLKSRHGQKLRAKEYGQHRRGCDGQRPAGGADAALLPRLLVSGIENLLPQCLGRLLRQGQNPLIRRLEGCKQFPASGALAQVGGELRLLFLAVFAIQMAAEQHQRIFTCHQAPPPLSSRLDGEDEKMFPFFARIFLSLIRARAKRDFTVPTLRSMASAICS